MKIIGHGTGVFLFLLGAPLGLVGCGNAPSRPVPAPIDPVDRQLMEAGAKVEEAWAKQNAILLASNPKPLPPTDISPGHQVGTHSERGSASLDDPMDLVWQGMLAPAVRQLAHKIDFRFREVGSSPTPPILVSLNYIHTPVLQILRAAGIQAGMRADVVVREDERTIEVVYHRGRGS